MGLRINTNVSSLVSQRSLARNSEKLSKSLNRLSTGQRINTAADDAAGLAISENLKADIRGTRQAKRNAGDAISLIQTAEGGLNEISNILIRLRELSVQSASDSIGQKEREFSDVEFKQLSDEVERIARSSEFNGVKLLDGSSGLLEFQIGIHNNPTLDRLRYDGGKVNATLSSLGVSETGVASKELARESMDKIDSAMVLLNGSRAELGAVQNRLTSIINNHGITDENLSAANSRIRDVDIASESAELTKNNILVQSGMSVLAQANQYPALAQKLLG